MKNVSVSVMKIFCLQRWYHPLLGLAVGCHLSVQAHGEARSQGLVQSATALGSAAASATQSANTSSTSSAAQSAAASATPATASSARVASQESGAFEGILFERGTKKPLADVNVFIIPDSGSAPIRATTDAKGRFRVEAVPRGAFRFVINQADYNRFELRDEFDPTTSPRVRRLFLERSTYQVFEITVRDRAKKRDDTTRSLKAEQFLTLPGANGDPVKAVQNLPGVARPLQGSSQIIIQGSSPQDTTYLLDQHEVPLVFHFGGLTSVITPEAVEQVDYLSAGYGPEFGRAMGGVVGLRTRSPERERHKSFLFMDTTKAGGLVEGPIDEKSSYLLTGRYSYIGFVLRQALKDNSAFDLTVAPEFWDLTGVYERKISDQDDLKVVSIFSHDELRFLFKEPLRAEPGLRGTFATETDFFRVIPQWTRRLDSGDTWRLSLGIGQDRLKTDIGDNFFDLESWRVTARGELERKVNEAWNSILGLDADFIRAAVDLRLPNAFNQGGIANPISSSETVEVSLKQDQLNAAPYWRNSIRAPGSKWVFMPSLRADYFSSTREFKPQPRLAARYEESEAVQYRTALGLYYQPPEPQEISDGVGNPDVTSPYAWHLTAGFERDFRNGSTQGFSLNAGVFHRIFQNLVLDSRRSVVRDGVVTYERYNNEGSGRATGAEVLLRYDGRPWSGFVAYTLSHSTRTDPEFGENLFRFDQTHNLNLVASFEGKNNWKYSGRVRYVTGNPVTPVIGASFDSDNDVYVPVRGAIYSERLSPFFQLDLRVDKKWIYEEWILWGYLDIQNLTNNSNPENVRYSYDYSQKTSVMGLPILPTLGVRGEF